MQKLIITQREGMELVDGAFWGFNPSDGLDIEDNIRCTDEKIRRQLRPIHAKDFPYAEDMHLCNYTYKRNKLCIHDTTDDNTIHAESSYFDMYSNDKLKMTLQHVNHRVYLSGRIDLCGGDNPNTIVVCNWFIVQKYIKDQLSKTRFKGFSFFEPEIEPNQTQIPDPKIYGINVDKIIGCWRITTEEKQLVAAVCPKCGYSPLVCPECFSSLDKCPRCNAVIFSHTLVGVGCDRITKEMKNTGAEFGVIHNYYRANILPGEYWHGDDLFTVIGAANGEHVMTKPMLDWFENNQFGPLLAYPFQVDISRCSQKQKDTIMKLLD